MGNIGPIVRSSLESHGLSVTSAEFPQNIFRDEFGYGRGLMKAVDAFQPAVIFPIGDPLALSRLKKVLPAGVTAATESEEKLKTMGYKVPFSCLMSEMGIRQPFLYSSVEEADGQDVIFKRDVSFGGHGVHRPRTAESIMNLIAHQPEGEPYLIEEYIDGDDWSVDAVRFGDMFRYSAYRTVSSRGNGPSTRREIKNFPVLGEIAKAIMDHVDYNGVCGFDFKVDSAGIPYILECNPRFTGGIGSQIEAGFDIPYYLWEGCCNVNL